MDMKQFLSMNLPEAIRITQAVGVSADQDSRDAGETKVCNVTFIFDTTWTVQDLVDRLMVAQSPKVAVQNGKLRKLGTQCPKTFEYKVAKAGQRVSVDSREVAIAFFMSKGLTREKAEFMTDNIKAASDMMVDTSEAE